MKANAPSKFLLVAAVLISSSCSKKSEDDMGSVQVSLANGTSSSLNIATPAGATGTAPWNGKSVPTYEATTYGIKLVQIYLNEDIAADGWTNSGTNAYIWINPICGTSTADSGAITMANNGSCDTTKITSYFELARSSEAVNSDLNSQKIPVLAKTYRYIRVQLCDNQISDKNLKVASTTGGLNTATELRTGDCILTPVKIDPPLEVNKDDVVKVSLKYDLSQALIDYDYDIDAGTYSTDTTAGDQCAGADSGNGVRCPNDLTYTVSVSK